MCMGHSPAALSTTRLQWPLATPREAASFCGPGKRAAGAAGAAACCVTCLRMPPVLAATLRIPPPWGRRVETTRRHFSCHTDHTHLNTHAPSCNIRLVFARCRRVTPTGQPAPPQVPVVWEVSRSPSFWRVHRWGRTLATAARDYTVKVGWACNGGLHACTAALALGASSRAGPPMPSGAPPAWLLHDRWTLPACSQTYSTTIATTPAAVSCEHTPPCGLLLRLGCHGCRNRRSMQCAGPACHPPPPPHCARSSPIGTFRVQTAARRLDRLRYAIFSCANW